MSSVFKIWRLMVCAVVSMCCSAWAEGIHLASGGQTDYLIVKPDQAGQEEDATAADLAHYLTLITGAKFPILTDSEALVQGGKTKFLYIGRRAPSDNRPLAEWERRIKTEKGDFYFSGWGNHGVTFAVYDFLDKYFGCRWFSFRGNEKIPVNHEAVLPELDYSHIPSFPIQMYCSFSGKALEQAKNYERRNRIFILQRSTPMLITGHVPDMMVPPGGKYKNETWKPFPLFEGEEWFDRHPDYFSMDADGKRVPGVQLCYSNPELRKLLNEKYEAIIKHYGNGEAALVKCNLNDNWGIKGKTLCCCPGCMELVKKYDDPAGPYWDYMIELCNYLKERYPEITVEGSTYQISEKVPECITRLPENLMIGYAPLWRNFLKPFTHLTNERLQQNLELSLAKFQKVRVQIYPTVYPWDTTIQPLVADLRQWGESLRMLKHLGVSELTAELGYGWQSETSFSNLRHYLIARLADNVELDVEALVVEYMEFTYGKAAQAMIAYWRELEQCEADETVGLMWTGLPYGAYHYLDAEHLSRWSQAFDAMEGATADEPQALAAVKAARVNLDEAILSVWPRLPKRPEFELAVVLERARKNIAESFHRVVAFEPDEKKRQELFDFNYNRRVLHGIDYFEYCARKPKPLKIDRPLQPGAVLRQIPTHRRHAEYHQRSYSDDPSAAFGVSMWFDLKNKESIASPKIRRGEVGGNDEFVAMQNPRPIVVEELRKNVGNGYNLYYVGRTRLWPQCVLWLGGLRRSMNVQLSHLYNPNHPELEYDIYLSIKYRKEPSSAYLGEAVLIRCDQYSPTVEKTRLEEKND